jgi:hypothetical protein
MAYSISCPCGMQVEVSEAQAGAWVTCSCGRNVSVPSLRELRNPRPSAPATGIRDSLPPPASSSAPATESAAATDGSAGSEASAGEPTQAVYNYAAERLIKDDVPPAQVRNELMAQGLSEEVAALVVRQLQAARNGGSREAREAGQKNMLLGALWCIGGTVVTVVSYSAASGGGGRYIIAWGAIIFGAIQFFRGLSQMSHE